MYLETKANLNMLLAKCTSAVAPTATGKSKNKLKTGSIRVPSPKPEKKVKPAPKRTVIETIKYSMTTKKGNNIQ